MISLCMIVKDEAPWLVDCIARVSPFVDQIVIVDTGSTDGTPEVARKLGVELFTEQFVDFAQARNAALARTSQDWVLVLDVDEGCLIRKICSTWSRWRRAVTPSGIESRATTTLDGAAGASHAPAGFSRKLAGVSYVQPVYEEPIFPEQTAERVITCWDAAIHHYGYVRSASKMAQKRALYIGLLRRHLGKREEQGWIYAALASLSADAGDFNFALELMAQHAYLWPAAHYRMASVNHARILMAVGQNEWALRLVGEALAWPGLDPYECSRLENVRGLALGRLNRWHDSVEAFNRASAYGFPIAAYHINLALAQINLGLWPEALASLYTGIRLNPSFVEDQKRPEFNNLLCEDLWLHRLDTNSALFAWLESSGMDTLKALSVSV